MAPLSPLLFTDASKTGWSVHLLDLTAAMEMKTVQLALTTFKDWIMGDSVVLISDNAMTVNQKKKRGTVS